MVFVYDLLYVRDSVLWEVLDKFNYFVEIFGNKLMFLNLVYILGVCFKI